jgi:hypothetical protein
MCLPSGLKSLHLLHLYGTAKSGCGKIPSKGSSGPQALKRWFTFKRLTARVELVPFPFVMISEFSPSL